MGGAGSGRGGLRASLPLGREVYGGGLPLDRRAPLVWRRAAEARPLVPYLLPLLVMNRQAMFTLPIGITNFIGEYRAEWSLVMPMALISIIPPVLLFVFFQRQFVSGIAMTGMKG